MENMASPEPGEKPEPVPDRLGEPEAVAWSAAVWIQLMGAKSPRKSCWNRKLVCSQKMAAQTAENQRKEKAMMNGPMWEKISDTQQTRSWH